MNVNKSAVPSVCVHNYEWNRILSFSAMKSVCAKTSSLSKIKSIEGMRWLSLMLYLRFMFDFEHFFCFLTNKYVFKFSNKSNRSM